MLTGGDYVWSKPVLILIDELAGSGGDAFPMLMKAGARAKLFGNRTMGLGGSVEDEILVNSRATFRVTRGLFTAYQADGKYLRSDYIENIGVTPDVKWQHTLTDVRGGYLGYVQAFTAEALKLVP
jgi:C-terminal processing protease CtpA/Prc